MDRNGECAQDYIDKYNRKGKTCLFIVSSHRKVPIDQLAHTKRLSKDSNNYQNRNTVESNALTKLNNEGEFLKADEILQYIIRDYYQTRSRQ